MRGREDHIARLTAGRLVDVREALMHNRGMGTLARKWGISRPGATQWCAAHIDVDDRRRLSDNGTASIGDCVRKFDLVSRLELIALCRRAGWPDAHTAAGIGVSPANLCAFVARHAPDGLDQSIADLCDDEPQSAAA